MEKIVGKPGARRGFGRVEKRPSGRYRAAYPGPDAQLYRAPMTFGARDDAIAWLSARRAEIEMQVWAPEVAARGAGRRTVPTLSAYADIWLETRKTKGRELRPTTRRQYRMLLDKFISPTFGDERIDRISNEDVNAWYDALAPGRETIRAQSYSLLRTIFASAASERPHPLILCRAKTHLQRDCKLQVTSLVGLPRPPFVRHRAPYPVSKPHVKSSMRVGLDAARPSSQERLPRWPRP